MPGALDMDLPYGISSGFVFMGKQFTAFSVFREKDSQIRLSFFNAEKGLKIWQMQKQKSRK